MIDREDVPALLMFFGGMVLVYVGIMVDIHPSIQFPLTAMGFILNVIGFLYITRDKEP